MRSSTSPATLLSEHVGDVLQRLADVERHALKRHLVLQAVPRRADVFQGADDAAVVAGAGQKHLVLAERLAAQRLPHNGLLQLAQSVLLQGRHVKHGA